MQPINLPSTTEKR